MSGDDPFYANVSDPVRFQDAIHRFDEFNGADPNQEIINGKSQSRELVYAQRLSDWVITLAPDASEPLRLASRCQHLCRWEIPRASHEMTRAGYHQWRNELKSFHAAKSAQVLHEVGYPEEIVSRVQDLNLKKHFPADAESRILEDALCLVFLQFQFADLAQKTDEAKVINALQKSWKKMTPLAHDHALKLYYGVRERALIERALS